MGIETAALAAYASIGAAAYSVYKSATTSAPKAPEVAAPAAPPQASQAPDAGAARKQAQALYGGQGQSATQLTGLDGVAPSSLSLGKNTLLGA